MDISTYFKQNVYPVLINKNISMEIINEYQNQEQYLLNNKHIIDINYIESKDKLVPFSEIKWFINCKLCEQKNFYNWFYDPLIKNKSIIYPDNNMKSYNINTLEDLYKSPFFNYCKNCTYPVFI